MSFRRHSLLLEFKVRQRMCTRKARTSKILHVLSGWTVGIVVLIAVAMAVCILMIGLVALGRSEQLSDSDCLLLLDVVLTITRLISSHENSCSGNKMQNRMVPVCLHTRLCHGITAQHKESSDCDVLFA